MLCCTPGVLSGAFELFLAVFNHWLVLLSDEELYDNQSELFNVAVIVRLAGALKQAVLSVTMRPAAGNKSAVWLPLLYSSVTTPSVFNLRCGYSSSAFHYMPFWLV